MKEILTILAILIGFSVYSQEVKQKVVISCEEGIMIKEGSNIKYWLQCIDNPYFECEYELLLEKGIYTYIPTKNQRKRGILLVTNDSVFITFISDNLEFKIIK